MDDSGRDQSSEEAREVPAPEQVWGSEHPRLSGAGWRRVQQLEPVSPLGAADAPAAEPAGPETAEDPVEGLRRSTESRLTAIEQAIGALAKTVKEAAWSTSASEVRSEIDALRRSLAGLRGEAYRVDPTREIAEFLEAETTRIRSVIGEELRRGLAQVHQDTRVIERIRKEMESLSRSVAELRTSLPATSAEELAGIVQDEARATRESLARLRAEGPGGESERLEGLRIELESVRATLQALVERVAGVPSGEDISRTVEDGAERSTASIQDDLLSLRHGLDDLRRRSEDLDSAMTELLARAGVDAPGSGLERIRQELARAAEATDARARKVLAALARELVTVSEQQRELRDEVRDLATRILGGP